MYFGSVKFFKHLILTVVFGWMAIATGLAIFFGIRLAIVSHDKANSADENIQAVSEDVLTIPDNTSLEQIYLVLASKGYSTEDILEFLKDNDSNSTNAFIEKYKSTDAMAENKPDTLPSYASLYPDLYAEEPEEFVVSDKTIYLTFDDGPSENTLDVLSILDKYDIKATFFMSGSETEQGMEIMKKVADSGHMIGVHSYCHDYDTIYKDVESYLDDFNNTYNIIYNATGVKPQIFRFPGGSINSYNRLVYRQLTSEMTRRGFVYYDWNVSAEDASSRATWTSIYNNVLNGIEKNSNKRAIVLMHDSAGKHTTVNTLEDIIIELKNQGYEFAPLDNTVKPVTFIVPD